MKIVLEVPNPGPSYAARPYPVDLLVTTTLGARMIRFAPAPALTQQDIDHLVAAVLVKVGSCPLLVEPRFNLKWLIDPPFIDTIVHHYWEILIEGLQHGDALTLSSAAGKQLAHVNVLPGIATMLTALVAPLASEELQFMRMRDGDLELSEADFGIEIRQQLLRLQATVPLAATCLGVVASTLWSEHGVLAVLDQQLLALASRTRPARGGSPAGTSTDCWERWSDRMGCSPFPRRGSSKSTGIGGLPESVRSRSRRASAARPSGMASSTSSPSARSKPAQRISSRGRASRCAVAAACCVSASG